MDYVPGSIAALISGNVTPNGRKTAKRAFTPKKHQPSPNVTPKGETVIDRSIFLSPTLQKKKAIIKKSPKRIFQNQDCDITNDGDTSLLTKSPYVDKIKKHLKNDLEVESSGNEVAVNKNSSKRHQVKSGDLPSPKKKMKKNNIDGVNAEVNNETTPKKKKQNSEVENTMKEYENKENANTEHSIVSLNVENMSPKKKNKKCNSMSVTITNIGTNTQADNETVTENMDVQNGNKKSRKRKKSMSKSIENEKVNAEQKFTNSQTGTESTSNKSKKRKHKKKIKQNNQTDINQENNDNDSVTEKSTQNRNLTKSENKKNKNKKSDINPNAISIKDTDSEHESDNEIESENEEINKKLLETGSAEDSSDEEGEVKKPEKTEKESIKPTSDEIKRTIFVGNVLFSKKCKKEMKKIFSKHGTIETIRIRTIPVKDARVTPKLAVIKNELHPDRTTVNVYIKYADASSVDKALVENNTVLNDLHLRVSQSDRSGEDHDPRCSIFVGNIPFALEDEALRAKFENCGEIESVRIIRDRKTNAGKGFGYVNFTSKDGVELALAMSEEDLTMKNRILRVKRCTQATNKNGTNRQKAGNNLPNKNRGGNNFANRNQGGTNMVNRSKGGNNFANRNQDGNNMANRSQAGNNFAKRNEGGNKFANRNQGGNNFANRNQGGNNFANRNQSGKNFGNRQGNEESHSDGAYRRIANKRQNQDVGEGPSNKRPRNLEQPKEKKNRKEYVGLTAEKKKKNKFTKGQKKKKVLSEILAKKQ